MCRWDTNKKWWRRSTQFHFLHIYLTVTNGIDTFSSLSISEDLGYLSWPFPGPSFILYEDPSPDISLGWLKLQGTFYDTPQIARGPTRSKPASLPTGAGCAPAPPLFWLGTAVVTAVHGEGRPWPGLISKGLEVQDLSLRYEDNTYTCTLGDSGATKFIPDSVPSFIQEWIVVTKSFSIFDPLNQISSDLNSFKLV